MFYCSSARNAPFFETHVKPGDYAVLSKWITRKELIANHVGYTPSNFEALGSVRPSPDWRRSLLPAALYFYSPQQKLVESFLAARFSAQVPNTQRELYKLTIAITERLTPKILDSGSARLNGLIYPTIPMAGNCDNFALHLDFVAESLSFASAEFFLITAVEGMQMKMEILDFATGVSDEGELLWKGRAPQYKLGPGEEAVMTETQAGYVFTRSDGVIIPAE